MQTIQQMSITLPNDIADAVRAKVRAGEYASESEVICAGLKALMDKDRGLDSWLHLEVGPAYDALRADPSSAVTLGQLRERLAAERSGGNGA